MPAPILLNWEISNLNLLKELKIIGRAPDGSINSVQRSYDFTNDPLPPELRRFCQSRKGLDQGNNLVCKNVPIEDAHQTGDYIFTLTVIAQEGQEESKKTDPIKVQLYEIDKGERPGDIIVAWQVEDGEDIQVELLPFGEMNKLEGSMTYPLSYPPSSQTLTLRVTNKDGEQKTQSVVIETAK